MAKLTCSISKLNDEHLDTIDEVEQLRDVGKALLKNRRLVRRLSSVPLKMSTHLAELKVAGAYISSP